MRSVPTILTVATLVVAMSALIPFSGLIAHPGGLNAQGCHNNRSTGDYHCHRNPRASQPVEQSQSISGDVYYRNCDAARAAGAAPLYRGKPGYRPEMDRDNDGVACEPKR